MTTVSRGAVYGLKVTLNGITSTHLEDLLPIYGEQSLSHYFLYPESLVLEVFQEAPAWRFYGFSCNSYSSGEEKK